MNLPLEKEMCIAQELAQSAGKVAKTLQSNPSFTFKKDGDGPVSEADLKADEMIRAGLCTHFPNDVIISEETAEESGMLPQAHRIWLVDPIDGTLDFIRGGADYSVMIGLLIDGLPALGVVFSPETETTWVGLTYRDFAFAQREQHGVVETLEPLNANKIDRPVIVASKSHPSVAANSIAELLNPSQIIRMGSLGLKLAFMAEGKADLYLAPSRHIKVWDTCAPFAIFHAVGGLIHTFTGSKMPFGPTLSHKTPFFAVSPRFEAAFLARLADPDLAFAKGL